MPSCAVQLKCRPRGAKRSRLASNSLAHVGAVSPSAAERLKGGDDIRVARDPRLDLADAELALHLLEVGTRPDMIELYRLLLLDAHRVPGLIRGYYDQQGGLSGMEPLADYLRAPVLCGKQCGFSWPGAPGSRVGSEARDGSGGPPEP